MTRFSKVRGKGRKDELIEELQAQLRSAREELAKRDQGGQAPQTGDAMPKPKKRPRAYTMHDVRKLAYDYYEYMGGDVIDMKINNERAKCRAFASQMRVAEGRDHFNQGAWGPDITPYEERMGGALISRLIAQKDKLLEKYEAMMEASLKEQYELAEEFEQGEAPKVDFGRPPERPGSEPSGPARTEFSEEEKQEYFRFIAGDGPEPGPVVVEIQNALEAMLQDPRRASPDLHDLITRGIPIAKKAVAEGRVPDPRTGRARPPAATETEQAPAESPGVVAQ